MVDFTGMVPISGVSAIKAGEAWKSDITKLLNKPKLGPTDIPTLMNVVSNAGTSAGSNIIKALELARAGDFDGATAALTRSKTGQNIVNSMNTEIQQHVSAQRAQQMQNAFSTFTLPEGVIKPSMTIEEITANTAERQAEVQARMDAAKQEAKIREENMKKAMADAKASGQAKAAEYKAQMTADRQARTTEARNKCLENCQTMCNRIGTENVL